MLFSTFQKERSVADNGAARITRQLPVPPTQLLSCSAPGFQRTGKLLAELLFLLSKAFDLLLQTYMNKPPVSEVNQHNYKQLPRSARLTFSLLKLIGQASGKLETVLFLSTHLGYFFSNF